MKLSLEPDVSSTYTPSAAALSLVVSEELAAAFLSDPKLAQARLLDS